MQQFTAALAPFIEHIIKMLQQVHPFPLLDYHNLKCFIGHIYRYVAGVHYIDGKVNC